MIDANPLVELAPQFKKTHGLVTALNELATGFVFDNFTAKPTSYFKKLSDEFINEVNSITKSSTTEARQIYTLGLNIFKDRFHEFCFYLDKLSSFDADPDTCIVLVSVINAILSVLAFDESTDFMNISQQLVSICFLLLSTFTKKYLLHFKQENKNIEVYFQRFQISILAKFYSDLKHFDSHNDEWSDIGNATNYENYINIWNQIYPVSVTYKRTILKIRFPEKVENSFSKLGKIVKCFEESGILLLKSIGMLLYQTTSVLCRFVRVAIRDINKTGRSLNISNEKLQRLENYLKECKRKISYSNNYAEVLRDKLESILVEIKASLKIIKELSLVDPLFRGYSAVITRLICQAENATKYQESTIIKIKMPSVSLVYNLAKDRSKILKTLFEGFYETFEINENPDKDQIIGVAARLQDVIQWYIFQARFFVDEETIYQLYKYAEKSMSFNFYEFGKVDLPNFKKYIFAIIDIDNQILKASKEKYNELKGNPNYEFRPLRTPHNSKIVRLHFAKPFDFTSPKTWKAFEESNAKNLIDFYDSILSIAPDRKMFYRPFENQIKTDIEEEGEEEEDSDSKSDAEVKEDQTEPVGFPPPSNGVFLTSVPPFPLFPQPQTLPGLAFPSAQGPPMPSMFGRGLPPQIPLGQSRDPLSEVSSLLSQSQSQFRLQFQFQSDVGFPFPPRLPLNSAQPPAAPLQLLGSQSLASSSPIFGPRAGNALFPPATPNRASKGCEAVASLKNALNTINSALSSGISPLTVLQIEDGTRALQKASFILESLFQ